MLRVCSNCREDTPRRGGCIRNRVGSDSRRVEAIGARVGALVKALGFHLVAEKYVPGLQVVMLMVDFESRHHWLTELFMAVLVRVVVVLRKYIPPPWAAQLPCTVEVVSVAVEEKKLNPPPSFQNARRCLHTPQGG